MKKTRENIPPISPEIPESMAALAGGMADDFNNILTTVMGACSLIEKDDPANGELLQCVALIRASAEHAADLSDRLLRASRPEAVKNHGARHLRDPGLTVRSVRDKRTIHGIVFAYTHSDGASS